MAAQRLQGGSGKQSPSDVSQESPGRERQGQGEESGTLVEPAESRLDGVKIRAAYTKKSFKKQHSKATLYSPTLYLPLA